MRFLFLVGLLFLVSCSESGNEAKSTGMANSPEGNKANTEDFPRRLDPVTVRRDDMTPDYRRGPTSIDTNSQTALNLPPGLLEELKNPQGWEGSVLVGIAASTSKQVFKAEELVFTTPTIPNNIPAFSTRSAATRPWVAIAVRKLKIMDDQTGGAIITPDLNTPPGMPDAAKGRDGKNGGRDNSAGSGTNGENGVNGRTGAHLVSTIYLIVGEVELAGKTDAPPGVPPTFSIRNFDGAILREYTKSYPLLLRFRGGRGGDGGNGGNGGNGGKGRPGRDGESDILPINCTSGPGSGGNGGNAGDGGRGGNSGSGGKSANLVIVASPQAMAHLKKAVVILTGGDPGNPGAGGDPGQPGAGGKAGSSTDHCAGKVSDGMAGNYGHRGDAGYRGISGGNGTAVAYERNVGEWWPAAAERQ